MRRRFAGINDAPIREAFRRRSRVKGGDLERRVLLGNLHWSLGRAPMITPALAISASSLTLHLSLSRPP